MLASVKCPRCACAFQTDTELELVICPYCDNAIEEEELEDCEWYDTHTGARFDRDELGLDPEDDD